MKKCFGFSGIGGLCQGKNGVRPLLSSREEKYYDFGGIDGILPAEKGGLSPVILFLF